MPGKQHGLWVLSARQSQELLHKADASTAAPHLLCERDTAISEGKLLLQAAHICHTNRYVVLSKSVPGAGICGHTV